MGIPLTTGKLVTKVSEMEIGDYIPASYKVGTVGKNIVLGDTRGYTESPVTGQAISSATNSYWYMVKVAQGLLVSDRIFLNTLSWDTMNGYRWIQGNPEMLDNNIIPTMTSNTSPSGVASASSVYNTTYDAWKAFNNSTTGDWDAGSGIQSGWIAYDFIDAKSITSYSMMPSGLVSAPKDFTFEGTNDNGETWENLDDRKGITSWTTGVESRFTFSNNKPFKKYRINITSINSATSNINLKMIKMFETVGTIRSLTGGVAYADANGNKSTTDLGYGAFPTNEFDKYIMGFPQNKIQSGKTLDDIFHHASTKTWTQDTPAVTIGANTNRVTRGGSGNATFSQVVSSTSNTIYGFRPIFEYIE